MNINHINLLFVELIKFFYKCGVSVCELYFIAVEVTEGTLNKIEMAFKAYDPCFGCATHTLPGQMPLTVNIRNSNGEIIDKISR
jgi:Ni,Fe-hydrogenase I large subunit